MIHRAPDIWRWYRRARWLAWLPLSLVGGVHASEPATPPDRPTVAAVRIEPAEAPNIDGDPSDPVWNRAGPLRDFFQVEPVPYAAPTERTEVRVLYDRETLYVAVYCYDDEPGKIVATDKARDANSPNDDYVRIVLDPQGSRRNGYGFEITPLGARVDELLQNNTDNLTNWNVVWRARARLDADGWSAEFAIPFRELSFDPSRHDWGFDVIRQVKRHSENIRWASTPASLPLNDISLEGTLTGLTDLDQGQGLDVQLYALARYQQGWDSEREDTTQVRPSGNAYYKITPALTGTLTVNTDFSDAPLDPRQVNTTRFSLFTQEQRQFFLQDAAAFQFGGQVFSQAPGVSGTDPNAQPFFSRNIGLVNGLPVNLLVGGKLSGDIDQVRVGALSVRTDNDAGVPAQTLSVARVAIPVLSGSSLGLIATQGDPTGLTRNTVAGADFLYLESDLGNGQRLLGDSFYEHSDSSAVGGDAAFGTSLRYPNEPWNAEFDFKQVGEHFAPALGFANRTGIRDYAALGGRRWRYSGGPIRWLEIDGVETVVTGLDNRLQSRSENIPVGLFRTSGDFFKLIPTLSTENVDSPFRLPGNVTVAAGHHRWFHLNPHLETSTARPFSIVFDADCCTYFGGQYVHSDLNLDWRPSGTFEFQIEHNYTHLRVDGAETEIHVVMVGGDVHFTPDMSLSTQWQYDNISKAFTLLARYRWEYQPGQEIFVAIGNDALLTGTDLRARYTGQDTRALIRIMHTLQY